LRTTTPTWAGPAPCAVDLLGVLGMPGAVPVLLRCLDQEDDLDLRVQHAAARCARSAPSPSTAVSWRMPRRPGRLPRSAVWRHDQWDLHDERIYAVLLDITQRTPELGASDLAEYGDARALDVLAQTFDALPIREGDNPLANHVFIELRCAIEDLGGHLTEAQQHKFAQAEAPRRRFVAQMHWDVDAPVASARRSTPMASAPTGTPRPRTTKKRKRGRNAPC